MKKLLLILILALSFMGCNEKDQEINVSSEGANTDFVNDDGSPALKFE